MAKRTKKKAIGELKKLGIGVTRKGELTGKTWKYGYVIYRDKKGRFVSKTKVNGRRKVKIELWRYSKGTGRSKRVMSEKAYYKRKKSLSPNDALIVFRNWGKKNKIKVKMINGRIYIETGSP